MRALSRNTRRVTALTLAAALVIAVYLNWQYPAVCIQKPVIVTSMTGRCLCWMQ